MRVVKQSDFSRGVAAMLLALQAFVWQVAAAAQEPTIKVDIDKNGGDTVWYANWWVWVLIALFVIVIVAITRSGKTEKA